LDLQSGSEDNTHHDQSWDDFIACGAKEVSSSLVVKAATPQANAISADPLEAWYSAMFK
jgi:hypothetical protein